MKINMNVKQLNKQIEHILHIPFEFKKKKQIIIFDRNYKKQSTKLNNRYIFYRDAYNEIDRAAELLSQSTLSF